MGSTHSCYADDEKVDPPSQNLVTQQDPIAPTVTDVWDAHKVNEDVGEYVDLRPPHNLLAVNCDIPPTSSIMMNTPESPISSSSLVGSCCLTDFEFLDNEVVPVDPTDKVMECAENDANVDEESIVLELSPLTNQLQSPMSPVFSLLVVPYLTAASPI